MMLQKSTSKAFRVSLHKTLISPVQPLTFQVMNFKSSKHDWNGSYALLLCELGGGGFSLKKVLTPSKIEAIISSFLVTSTFV